MKGFDIKRKFYSLASTDGKSAEITLYGDVVESWPTDWWTGEKLEGNYIAQDEFLRDLDAVKKCKDVTIRINSYGGDSAVGFLIHNRLRELSGSGVKLICVVDGVAMSAASVIMCACDTVRINPSSLVMVHRCWSFLSGGYNADDLREQATAQEAYDKAIVSAYKRKTGLSETVLMHMMSDETYLTGKEAVEKGFADELIEDAEPVKLAASADGRSLFVNGQKMHLCPGMAIPDSIPTVDSAEETPAPTAVDTPIQNEPENTGEKGVQSMDIKELREKYPDLVAQVEADARSAATAEATGNAVLAEQKRIREIDEVATLFDAQLVQEAKYGEKACSAQELAYRAAQNAAKQGRNFLANLEVDNKDSGAQGVSAAPGEQEEADSDDPKTVEAKAKAAVAAYLKKGDK